MFGLGKSRLGRVNKLPLLHPTLDLRFSEKKYLDPRVTFTRASSGTYFDANGVLQTATSDVARFDHDPETGESLGLLVEEERTNLLLWSEDFRNTADAGETRPWINARSSITPNAIIAPDGTLTADKLFEDTTANQTHQVYQNITIPDGTTSTGFIHAKSGERTRFQMFIPGDASNVIFDLSNGTKSNENSGVIDASIIDVGDGWYRCSVTVQSDGTANQFFLIRLVEGDGANTLYTGDGTSGIYIWGADLQQGSFPSSYIKTTDSTVTREADVAVIDGDDFAEFYRQDEGTIYSEFSSFRPADSTSLFLYNFSQASGDYIAVRSFSGYSPDRVYPFVINGSVSQFSGDTTLPNGYVVMPIQTAKNALAYKANDFASSWNGISAYTDSSGSLPSPNKLFIGSNSTVNHLNGHIARLSYYPKRLPDAELEKLTS